MTESSSSRRILLPIAMGMLGATLALLFAPRSGKETREKMRSKAEDVKSQAEDNISSTKEKLDQGLKEVQELKNRLYNAFTETRESAKQAIDKVKNDQLTKDDKATSSILSTWEEEV